MQNDDQTGFDQLFEMYHEKIYYFSLHYGLGPADSQEIVQEVFVKFWHSRKKIDPSKNVQAYLYKIAKNVILDEFKRRVKQKAAEDYQFRLLQAENYTQHAVVYNELERLVTKILRELPEKRRLAFELSRYEGLSNKEIAREMGITVKTVETHLALALQSFRVAFRQAGIMIYLYGVFLLPL